MEDYEKKEKNTRCKFYAIVLLVSILNAAQDILDELGHRTISDIIAVLPIIIPMIALPYSYLKLKLWMERYHFDKFLHQKESVERYLLFDMVGYSL